MLRNIGESDWGLDVEWLVNYLLEHEVTPEEIARMTAGKVGRADTTFLPIDDYLALFVWASQRLQRPQLGFDISTCLQPSSLGIYGYLINHSPTIGSLLDVVVRYQPIFMRGMGYTLFTSDNRMELCWDIYRPPCEGVRLDVEFTLGALVRLLQLKLGDGFAPLEVSFRHRPVSPVTKYQEVFGCECRFEQQQNSVVFQSSLMQTPLSGGDPKLLNILKTQADSMMQLWEADHSFLGKIKFLITTSLGQPESSMESLAKQLNMTSRTLNRRLAKEGTSYQQLRDEIRIHSAKRALTESDASVTAIAGKLGFSESSAFVRAFKRVTGVTPNAYRSKVHSL